MESAMRRGLALPRKTTTWPSTTAEDDMRIPLIATFCLFAVALPLLADGNAKITEVNRGQFAIALGPNDSERLDAYLELKLRDPKRLSGEVEHDLQNTKNANGKLFEWDFKHNYRS